MPGIPVSRERSRPYRDHGPFENGGSDARNSSEIGHTPFGRGPEPQTVVRHTPSKNGTSPATSQVVRIEFCRLAGNALGSGLSRQLAQAVL